jgi:hypothetical protein
MKWPRNLWKMQGKWWNFLSYWIFFSTAHTKSSLTTDGQMLRGSSCRFS